MTATQVKLAVAGGLALLAWWLSRSTPAAPGRVTSTLDIDANVYSPTFGEPIVDSGPTVITGDDANHQRLVDLVDESSRAIAAYDATHGPIPY